MRSLSIEEMGFIAGGFSEYYCEASDFDSYYYEYDAGGGGGYDYGYLDFPMADYSSDFDSMIQGAVDSNNQWLADNPIQIEIFTIGDFTVSYSGSPTEGLYTAIADCVAGASGTKLGNDFGTVGGATALSSSQAGVIGCTLGVGAGIIRDLMP